MEDQTGLARFLYAQEKSYPVALQEIKRGKKQSHWMWYIFPQIAGLGFSVMAEKYAMKNIEEAEAFLRHPVLGKRLIEISEVLMTLPDKNARRIFGTPDDLKLKSCMTLFQAVTNSDPVFGQVLSAYYNGEKDKKTIALIT